LVHARVTLREKAEHLVGLLDRRIVGRRYFPRLSAGLHDKPAVDELVRCISDHLLISNIWIGAGELNFPEAYGEELEVLGPLEGGARISILVFLFRHRYRDPGISDCLQSWLMPTSALWIAAGINKSTHFDQINCGWFR
jgi:hypothetical protein